jgi:hypothetical protein
MSDTKTDEQFVFMATAAIMRSSIETSMTLHEVIDVI